jgi:hypothetical protein
MKRENRRTLIAAVTSAALAAVAVGGVAEARTPSSIHACAAKHGGALRLAKKCKAQERAVSWGHVGPAGPTGPSDVYVKQIRVGATVPIAATGYTRIMTLTVPAGSYLVTLTINASVGSETSAALFCHVGSNSNLDDYVDNKSQYQSASAQGVTVVSGPSTLAADCATLSGNSGGTAGIFTAQLTAVKTGSVHIE